MLRGFCREVTLPSGHAGRYSSCHYPQANLIVETKSRFIFKLSLMITVIRLASGGSESEYGARESVAGTSHCHGHGASHAG